MHVLSLENLTGEVRFTADLQKINLITKARVEERDEGEVVSLHSIWSKGRSHFSVFSLAKTAFSDPVKVILVCFKRQQFLTLGI